jgi:hypothetical protein
MRKNVFKRVLMVCTSLAIFAIVVTSCSKKEETVTPANLTTLTAVLDSCTTLLNSASTTLYPQAAITAFQTVVTGAQTAAADKSVSQVTIDNLVVQLRVAEATFLAASYDAIPSSALIFGLSFDEGSGTQLTTSGSNAWTATLAAGPSQLFGTNTGLPTFVTGKVGTAMHFGAGSHLEINNYTASALLVPQLSIAVWVKTDSVRANNYIISYNDWYTWKFQTQNDGKPFFTVNTTLGGTDADNQMVNSVPNNTWTHLVVTLDLTAGTETFYINGVSTMVWTNVTKPNLGGTMVPYTPVSVSQLPLLIGAGFTYAEANAVWPASWGWNTIPNWAYFTGSMDELKVYNVCLTAGQVSQLYNTENGK